ncbi:MAG: LCP family protein, partial [bacterium]|nr:LCP family protein [bacterium]
MAVLNKVLFNRIVCGVLSLVLMFSVAGTVLVLNSLGPKGSDEPAIILNQPSSLNKINVLVLGADAGLLPGGIKAATRTDTIMVVSYDQVTKVVNVLSLPRDSRVIIPGKANLDKITHAHVYGGVALSIKTVELLLDIPIHYYIRGDSSGFRQVVDAIGGVEYEVEADMFYEDPYQDLYINLKKGLQLLNGSKAEQYVRYRNDSDIYRIARQQKFLVATFKTLLKPINLLRIDDIVRIGFNSVFTNIGVGDIIKHLGNLSSMNAGNVSWHTAPGKSLLVNGGWYWVL